MIKKWFAIPMIALLLLSSCSKEKEVVQLQEGEGEEIDEVEMEEIEQFPYTYPLTGIGSNEEVTGRPYAVMINNHPKARQQSGLQKADVIYELLAEGEVTRFLAIFQSEAADQIGPVRSARDYYIELAKGYNALYIAHGYSPDAKEMLDNGYIDHINGMVYDGKYFTRSSSRVAPHNSYTSSQSILEGAEKIGYNMSEAPAALTFLTTDEMEQLAGEKADSVAISYYNSKSYNVIYEYDKDLEKYKRVSNGELTADLETGDPVLIDNLFIIETNHKVIDDVGRRDINLTSGGNGYLLQKGQWNKVEWENRDGKILPYANGKAVGLVPGKTWINVVPSNQGLEALVSFDEQ